MGQSRRHDQEVAGKKSHTFSTNRDGEAALLDKDQRIAFADFFGRIYVYAFRRMIETYHRECVAFELRLRPIHEPIARGWGLEYMILNH